LIQNDAPQYLGGRLLSEVEQGSQECCLSFEIDDFFLLNFGYIGTAIAVGADAYELLPRKKKPIGR